MSKFSLSVVVIAKNEAVNIRRCLEAVAWCDDIVVIDDYSSDETVSIALECGAKVLQHHFSSFAAQRNWALANADLKNRWALMLDADEVVTPELQRELRDVLRDPSDETVGYKMCRKTMFQGTWLRFSDGFPVWIVRLVRVGTMHFHDAGHGEVPVPVVEGHLGTVAIPFLHFPFSKGLHDWCERHNRYSTREAQRELDEASSFQWRNFRSADRALRRQTLRAFSRRLPCRFSLRFVYQYIVKGGILEGRAGMTFSWLMAVYEGLIVLKRRELLSERERRQCEAG